MLSTNIVFVVLGLIALVWSADLFVKGSSQAASRFGLSPLIIGMLFIGVGTSAPELVVSIIASIQGKSGLVIGNVYGSNIANIALILGVTSLLVPVMINSQVIQKELPILLAATFISAALIYELNLSRFDSMILLALLILFFGRAIKKNKIQNEYPEINKIDLASQSTTTAYLFSQALIGLVILILSSRALVYGAVGIASGLGVSDVVIGLTIVAVGTSLPELASSIIAARRGEPEIALGNVIGSNLFNTLGVLGIGGLISPIEIDEKVFTRDVSVTVLLTMILFLFSLGFKGKRVITRIHGALLLTSFIGYNYYLVYGSF